LEERRMDMHLEKRLEKSICPFVGEKKEGNCLGAICTLYTAIKNTDKNDGSYFGSCMLQEIYYRVCENVKGQ
jgi:hypothetical protein